MTNTTTACPFYGMHAVPEMRLLVSQNGNQCALILDAYSPCRMEMRKETPDLSRCELKSTELARMCGQYKSHSFKSTERLR